MLAYHNNPELKAQIIATLEQHRLADELVKGQYWEGGKGCAVGCTIKGSNHQKYEPIFGIPQTLARFEDKIFEGLPNNLAMAWPTRFMLAIKPGADLRRVQWGFLAWCVVRTNPAPSKVTASIIGGLYSKYAGKAWVGLKKDKAYDDAAVAANAAYYAAYYAANAAHHTAVAAANAANAAVAAVAAANAAVAAVSAAAANAAVGRENFWITASDELIRLIELELPQ